MGRPKAIKKQTADVAQNPEPEKSVQPVKSVNLKDLPVYVTIIGCGGTLVVGKEYPNTHRNVAVKLIEKCVATLKQ